MQLTSTLELGPLLQNNILENAVGILNCEAGSLFLVDEQTGELVFKGYCGTCRSKLDRVSACRQGTGIVGRAVQMRRPMIENEEQRSTPVLAESISRAGFISRALMAVPLQVKDRGHRVIEVINRRDGLPFCRGRPSPARRLCGSGGGGD
ncbi:MAG: GAF domain-containing protein [Anaerolineales bacterium]|nr:GAF domain-containing protein [Anaerolineales bacterium]